MGGDGAGWEPVSARTNAQTSTTHGRQTPPAPRRTLARYVKGQQDFLLGGQLGSICADT